MPEGGPGGAEGSDSISAEPDAPNFWFVRLFLRVRVPVWLGAIVLAAVAFGGFTLLDWLVVGSLGSVVRAYVPFHIVFFEFAAIFLGRETERILKYAESMGAGGREKMRRVLYDTRWAAVTALPIEVFFVGSVVLTPGFEPTDLFRQAAFLGIFHIFVGASALWAFVYSMKSIYDIGRTRLSLRSFAEDHSLGLKPFGTSALRLVAIYELAILAAAIPLILVGDYMMTGVATFATLGLLGFVVFFLPLLSFRSQLLEAKANELAWIGQRYAGLLEAVRDGGNSLVDEKVAGSLSALGRIREDVQKIHTWPFDDAIAARLISVTILPLVVSVVARVVILLTLGV